VEYVRVYAVGQCHLRDTRPGSNVCSTFRRFSDITSDPILGSQGRPYLMADRERFVIVGPWEMAPVQHRVFERDLNPRNLGNSHSNSRVFRY
jgi:hypothetical protein